MTTGNQIAIYLYKHPDNTPAEFSVVGEWVTGLPREKVYFQAMRFLLEL